MKTVDKNQLMDQLAAHGYELMRPKSVEPGEKVLVQLLQQDDSRLLEGFPVVLAGMLKEKGVLALEDKAWRPGRELSKKSERRFVVLLGLSGLLFELFGFKDNSEYVFKFLTKRMGTKEKEKLMARLLSLFLKSETVDLDDEAAVSTERLKNNFRNYLVHQAKPEDVQKKRHALELELLLSELFTTRQKELLRKRLEEKTMTKTEREYFYRVVSKRLKALASEELHQMAKELVAK